MSVDVVTPVLAKAISDLRAGHNRYEVANDLALLHAHLTVTAPAVNDRGDGYTAEYRQALSGTHKRWDAYRRAHIRLVKREEIQAEVDRGEHDSEHDYWSAD